MESKKTVSMTHALVEQELQNLHPVFAFTQFNTEEEAENQSNSKNEQLKLKEKERKKPEIPQSMAEVYELSNQVKRKRNKEKKKLKEETSGKVESIEESSSLSHKKKLHQESNPADFMADIGWVKPNAIPQILSQTGQPLLVQPQQIAFSYNSHNSLPSSPHKPDYPKLPRGAKPQITPFDYSSVKPSKPHPQNSESFRPYSKSKTSPSPLKRGSVPRKH